MPSRDPRGPAPAPAGASTAAAVGGLLFLHLPLAFIVLYAFSTDEKSFSFPLPGLTPKWFGVVLGSPRYLGGDVAVGEGGGGGDGGWPWCWARWRRRPCTGSNSSAARW